MALRHDITTDVQVNKTHLRENMEGLDVRIVALELFEQRAATTAGLTFGFGAGRVRDAAGAVIQVAAGTVALTASATNYIEVTGTGAVVAATARTLANKPLYQIVTGATAITSVINERISFDFS